MSCAFCVLASRGDLRAAARCEDNADIYRELVRLEACSTFSFQPGHWLGDVAPALLDASLQADLAQAKERAQARLAAEAEIPRHLLYTAGWPTCLPTSHEARHLAAVRRRVAKAVGIEVGFCDGSAVLERYRHLLGQRREAASA